MEIIKCRTNRNKKQLQLYIKKKQNCVSHIDYFYQAFMILKGYIPSLPPLSNPCLLNVTMSSLLFN